MWDNFNGLFFQVLYLLFVIRNVPNKLAFRLSWYVTDLFKCKVIYATQRNNRFSCREIPYKIKDLSYRIYTEVIQRIYQTSSTK